MSKMNLGKVLIFVLAGAFLLTGTACKKKSENTNATMSATINGSSVSFSVTISGTNSGTVIQGNSSKYTLTLIMKTLGAGIYTLGDPANGYYATVSDNFGYSYSTDAANTGQITLTQSGSKYNGTFYFTANETSPSAGGGNVNVTSGNCSGI